MFVFNTQDFGRVLAHRNNDDIYINMYYIEYKNRFHHNEYIHTSYYYKLFGVINVLDNSILNNDIILYSIRENDANLLNNNLIKLL